MATEQQQPPEGDETRPEYAVADPEEFNQTERLRTINQVRKQAGETIEATMTRLRTDEQFDVHDRQQILRSSIYRYLTEIEWLARKAESEEFLSEIKFGTVQLEPPEELTTIVAEHGTGEVQVIGTPDLNPKTWDVVGLKGYLTAPEVFEHSWSVRVDSRHDGPSAIQGHNATYMPAHVSLNAYRMANRFLAQNGIDVDISETEHRVQIDRPIMEEVEQWRKQTLR